RINLGYRDSNAIKQYHEKLLSESIPILTV
ncbi:unnamed protein product, partial [marine sediment metagenome]